MYNVYKHSRLVAKGFNTYEKARQAMRKIARKKIITRESRQPPAWELYLEGYTIRKVS